MMRFTAGTPTDADIVTVPAEQWQSARWKAATGQDVIRMMARLTVDTRTGTDTATVPARRRRTQRQADTAAA